MTEKVGTIYYISPEIIKGKYNEKCDIWAIGVMVFALLCGYFPFVGNSDQEIYQKIKSEKFDFPQKDVKTISRRVKDLIFNMICSEQNRFSAKKILDTKLFAFEVNLQEINIEIERLIDFASFNELKKYVLFFIASRLKINECIEIKDLFMKLDFNHNGVLNKNDFITIMLENESCNKLLDSDHASELFEGINIGKNGEISFTEFLSANLHEDIYLKEELLYEAFHVFSQVDADIITENEILQRFNMEINNETKKKAEKLIEINDFDKDGKINFKDFCRMMKKNDNYAGLCLCNSKK